jgi:WD40 repeat protein
VEQKLDVSVTTCIRFSELVKKRRSRKENQLLQPSLPIMYTLEATQAFRIDNPPEKTYIYHIEPVADEIAVISSDNCLRLINPVSLQGPAVNVIPKVHADVTCLKALDGQSGIVCTAGRDGQVNIWDLRGKTKVAELKTGMLAIFRCPLYNFFLQCLQKPDLNPPLRIKYKVELLYTRLFAASDTFNEF